MGTIDHSERFPTNHLISGDACIDPVSLRVIYLTLNLLLPAYLISQILEHAATDPVVFSTSCKALVEQVDALGDAAQPSQLNSACRLLGKVVEQGCQKEDEADYSQQNSTATAAVKSSIEFVGEWLKGKATTATATTTTLANDENVDAENAAPKPNQTSASPSPFKQPTAGVSSATLSKHFDGKLSSSVAAALCAAVTSRS